MQINVKIKADIDKINDNFNNRLGPLKIINKLK